MPERPLRWRPVSHHEPPLAETAPAPGSLGTERVSGLLGCLEPPAALPDEGLDCEIDLRLRPRPREKAQELAEGWHWRAQLLLLLARATGTAGHRPRLVWIS